MAWLPFKKSLPIYIVFQDDCIRYVKLKSQTPLVVQKVGEKWIPGGIIQEGKIIKPKVLSQLLKKGIQEWKIAGKNVRFAIPDSISVIRKIPIPAIIPEQELKDYINVELGASIHIPFEEPVIDIHRLQKKDENVEYLLFAAPENVMAEYVSILEDAKLKPFDAELSSLASYRLFHHLDLVDNKKHYLCLHIDRYGINATAFFQHTPVFTLYISMNAQDINEKDESTLNITLQDAFNLDQRWNEVVTEVDRVMSFYQFSLSEGSETFNSFMITGDHPELESFANKLSASFNLPFVEIPENKVSLDRGLQVPVAFYTTVGLGMKGE